MKKHKSFEKTFAAQAGRVDELEQSAVQLVAGKHYDSEAIQQTLQAVCQRRSVGGAHWAGDWGGGGGLLKKVLASMGVEPMTFALLARRSNQLR